MKKKAKKFTAAELAVIERWFAEHGEQLGRIIAKKMLARFEEQGYVIVRLPSGTVTAVPAKDAIAKRVLH